LREKLDEEVVGDTARAECPSQPCALPWNRVPIFPFTLFHTSMIPRTGFDLAANL